MIGFRKPSYITRQYYSGPFYKYNIQYFPCHLQSAFHIFVVKTFHTFEIFLLYLECCAFFRQSLKFFMQLPTQIQNCTCLPTFNFFTINFHGISQKALDEQMLNVLNGVGLSVILWQQVFIKWVLANGTSLMVTWVTGTIKGYWDR
jgi:hypothetical protein